MNMWMNQTDFNLTLNQSDGHSLSFKFFKVCEILSLVGITLITLIGLYGNTVSIVIFLGKCFNKNTLKSVKIYLIALSMSYLLLIVFINLEYGLKRWATVFAWEASIFSLVDHYSLACRLIPHVKSAMVYFSTYTFMTLLLQRLIIFTDYNLKFSYNSASFNKRLLLAIFVLSFIFSSYNLFTRSLDEKKSLCTWTINKVTIGVATFSFTFIILIPFVAMLTMSIILHKKLRYFQNLLKQYESESAVDSDEPRETTTNALSEMRKYNTYLNHLDNNYPQLPDSALFDTQSNGLSLLQTTGGRGDKNLVTNVSHSIHISAMIASISKYIIALRLPYIMATFISKIYEKSRPHNDAAHMIYFLEGLVKLAEVCSFVNCASFFFTYHLYGKSFRREHKKLVFNFLQLVYYFLVRILVKPYQACQSVFHF
jgi:hypothetical protein